jgi:hypothetical protein
MKNYKKLRPKKMQVAFLDNNISYSLQALHFAGHGINSPPDAGAKIISFSNLPEGWDYGNGGPIPDRTIIAALEWNLILVVHGFSNINAFPGSGGEIVVASSNGDHYIEVIVEADETVSLAYDFKRRQVFYRLRMDAEDAKKLVKSLAGTICNVSTLYTAVNITLNKISGLGQHSGIIRGPYQSLGAIASMDGGSAFAITSANTMVNSPEISSVNLQFSGDLTRIFSQPEAA